CNCFDWHINSRSLETARAPSVQRAISPGPLNQSRAPHAESAVETSSYRAHSYQRPDRILTGRSEYRRSVQQASLPGTPEQNKEQGAQRRARIELPGLRLLRRQQATYALVEPRRRFALSCLLLESR